MSGGIGDFVIGTSPIGGGSDQAVGMLTSNLLRLAILNSGAVGISQTIYAEEMYVALNMLNGLLAQWQRRRWLVWALTDTTAISTGATSYTIGSGGQFNTGLRPDRIESAFARLLVFQQAGQAIPISGINGGTIILPPGSALPTDPTGLPAGAYYSNGGVLMVVPGAAPGSPPLLFLDYPLFIVPSREDYNQIVLKQLTTFPAAVFYDSQYPLGNLFFWPIPVAGQWELHVTTKQPMPQALALSTNLAMPPEYQQALMYTLACMFRPAYGMPPDPTLLGQARAAVNTVRMANTQIPELQLPAAVLPGTGRGGVAAGSSPGFQSGWMM